MIHSRILPALFLICLQLMAVVGSGRGVRGLRLTATTNHHPSSRALKEDKDASAGGSADASFDEPMIGVVMSNSTNGNATSPVMDEVSSADEVAGDM